MNTWPGRRGTLLLATAMLAALAAGQAEAAREPPPMKPQAPGDPAAPGQIAGLPFARGRTFARLDDYLDYRRTLGAQDIPYYQPVAPDRYELITLRAAGDPPRYFTRAELLAKFGFKQ